MFALCQQDIINEADVDADAKVSFNELLNLALKELDGKSEPVEYPTAIGILVRVRRLYFIIIMRFSINFLFNSEFLILVIRLLLSSLYSYIFLY